METPQLKAGGDINPCRFVDITGSFTVSEADASDIPLGISGEATRDAPLPSGQSALHAKSGDAATVYVMGNVCLLEIGTGGVTAGDRLKPDADGKGITSGTAGEIVGAVALETASADEFAKVFVLSPGSQR